MKCRHCGKEYDDSFSYCPYCAEPKPAPVKEVTIDEQIKNQNRFVWVEGILLSILIYIPVVFFSYVALLILLVLDAVGAATNDRAMTVDASWFNFERIALIAIGISLFIGLIYILAWFLSSRRNKIIEIQFNNDTKSICPVCGSHSIALGRKGYDWNKGYWYRIFNIKGGHYLAGMDSRRVTAHCQNCGHSWLTNETWLR